tara:strand:- start:82 stop:285 length:204 start_codon:yes stop_codon:yes gene_type:complete
MPIKPKKFNKAKDHLSSKGSKSAEKCHPAHAKGGDVPDRHGKSLVSEAAQEGIAQVNLTKAEDIMGI